MQFNWENFTYDTAWLEAAVQTETKAGCDIQVGGAVSSSTPSIAPSELQAQLKQVRLQSLLFGELHALLEDSGLGAGKDAAFTEGRQLIRERLQHLSSEQQRYFEALIAENEASAQDSPLRIQLRQVLCSLLNETDWQQIAQVAMGSIQAHFFQQVILH